MASPIAWLEAAQAVVAVELYPRAPVWWATLAEAMLGSTIGKKKGDIRIPPRLARILQFSSSVGNPPLPFPRITPTR